MNGWDNALREAKAEGEVLVVKGDLSDLSFEIEVVKPCERAFSPA